MKEEPRHSQIEPELEARIVALVLGEASDFEGGELDRLIKERPELAMLKKRIEAMHRLLRDVASGEMAVADDDWKLPEDKRNKVLAVIDGVAQVKPAKKVVSASVDKSKLTKRQFFWNFSKIAALLCVVGFTINMMLPASQIKLSDARKIRLKTSNQLSSNWGYALKSDDVAGPPTVDDYSTPIVPAAKSNNPTTGLHRELAAKPASDSPKIHSRLADSETFDTDGVAFSADDGRLGGFGGGGGGGGGGMLSDQNGDGIAAERQHRENAQRRGLRQLGVVAKESSKSMVAGRYFKTEKKEVDEIIDLFNPNAETALTYPAFEPTTRTSGKDLEKERKLEITNGRVELLVEGEDNTRNSTRSSVYELEQKVTLGDLPRQQRSGQRSGPAADTAPGLNGQQAGSNNDSYFAVIPPRSGGSSSGKFSNKYLPAIKTPAKKSAVPTDLNEILAADEAFSTFSLHVSDVSFKLAQAALARGEWPEATKIRIEEFVNAFDYGDPMPSPSEKVACRLEQTIHPFLQQRNLLRVSLRTAAAGRSADTPLRLTFLLDNSGSMERTDRQKTVRSAFSLLVQQLQPIDQVTLISFARQPRLLADQVSGAQSHQLVQLVRDLPSEGGTNFEAALRLAKEKAQEQQIDHGQNRIIMLTDGAANLGDANPESLSRLIETIRSAGIAFDAAGIGAEGLNDEILEALTRKGDGRYYLLDQPEDADAGFIRQIAGALRPAAKNVKVQIEFNPKRVGRYQLLGFEKHRLLKEDFHNDQVDAAEMAAAEAGVAIYQFEAKADGEGDVGSVSVRFQDMSSGQMVENRWPIPYQADIPRLEQATPSLRIATSAALLAAKLRGGSLAESVDLKTLSHLIGGLPDRQRNTKQVQQLQQMIQQARQVSGD